MQNKMFVNMQKSKFDVCGYYNNVQNMFDDVALHAKKCGGDYIFKKEFLRFLFRCSCGKEFRVNLYAVKDSPYKDVFYTEEGLKQIADNLKNHITKDFVPNFKIPKKCVKVYLPSNTKPELVEAIQKAGHKVYWNPTFNFGLPDWENWTLEQSIKVLDHPIVEERFELNYAMQEAEVCVISGLDKSSHLEAGWFAGSNRRLIILVSEMPEIMYSMAYAVCGGIQEVLEALEE